MDDALAHDNVDRIYIPSGQQQDLDPIQRALEISIYSSSISYIFLRVNFINSKYRLIKKIPLEKAKNKKKKQKAKRGQQTKRGQV